MSAESATVSFRTESGAAEDEPWMVIDSAMLSNTVPWWTFRWYLIEAHLTADHDGKTPRRASIRPGFMAPAQAASTAVAVTAAFRVLGQPEIQRAGIVMHELV